MSIESMVAAEQARYVAFFDEAVARAKAENPLTASELLIAINNEAIPYPYRYLRVDLVQKADDGSDRICELWLDPDEASQARAFDLAEIRIELHPFSWYAAQIVFDRPLPDEQKLKDFLTLWLDPEDGAFAAGRPRADAIHSATPIESSGGLHSLIVDFGTAPPDALLDLLDLLANAGMTRIIVTGPPAG